MKVIRRGVLKDEQGLFEEDDARPDGRERRSWADPSPPDRPTSIPCEHDEAPPPADAAGGDE